MRVGRWFALWAALWMLHGAAWSEARVYGRVTDGAGAPIAGAIISFTPPDPWSVVEPVEAGRTDGDGRYAVEADERAAAKKLIAIWAEGFVPVCQTVAFEPGRAVEANFTLEEWASLSVRLIGPDGPIDQGIAVLESRRQSLWNCGGRAHGPVMDSPGPYHPIPGGVATVRELIPGSAQVSMALDESHRRSVFTVDLVPGETGELTIDLSGPMTASVRALVLDDGVPVTAQGGGSLTVDGAAGLIGYEFMPNASGEFRLDSLPAGKVVMKLGCTAPGDYRRRTFYREFNLAVGESVDIGLDLANAGTIDCAVSPDWNSRATTIFLFFGTLERPQALGAAGQPFFTMRQLGDGRPLRFEKIEARDYTVVLADGEGNPLAWQLVQVVKDAVTRVSFE